MKRLILLLFFIFSILSIKGQTYFNNEFTNDSSMWDNGAFVHEFPDTSGYLVVGFFPMPGYIGYIRFHRLNILGDTVWTKHYRNRPLGQIASLGNYINLGDTNFVFVGTYSPESSDSAQINLFKIDDSGNVLWDYIFGDPSKETNSFDIQQTKDGGYIITGYTTGWGANNIANSFLLKVDSLGNEEWKKVYSIPSGIYDISSSVDTTNDNGYIISGSVTYNSTGNQSDIFVLRADSLGAMQWITTYGSPYGDWGRAYVKKSGLNDYLLAGGISIDYGNGLNSQTYLAKIDGQNGNIIWSDTSGTDQSGYDEGFDSTPIILNSGDIVLIGAVDRTLGGAGVSALLCKYSSAGVKQWDRVYNKYGANNNNYFWDIHETYDKGFIICGDFLNISVPVQPLWVLKLDSMGCDTINCTVGIEDEISEENELLVYPNPSNTFISFELPFNLNQINAELRLFNITGKEVFVKKINSHVTQIDVSSYPKGIYFYQLINEKNSYSGKLVIN
ncbi:MAG: hypothetical protein COA97_11175 [Flavobacteriales bacterium]|nr:MAG: hypothetical protein COA97_11175 [Flavobacteriales bacterium]